MLCPGELVAAVTLTAVSISESLSAADTALLAAVLTQLGDTLATIAAAKDRAEQCGAAAQFQTAAGPVPRRCRVTSNKF